MVFERGMRRILAGLSCIALIAACQEGVRIAVAQEASGVNFSVLPRSEAFRTCIRSVYVYRSDEGDGAAPIWHLERIDPEQCISQIRFGETPTGFAGKAPLSDLESDTGYRVALMGPGFNEQADFRREKAASRLPRNHSSP